MDQPIPRVILSRIISNEEGTLGLLKLPGLILVTLELPWKNNKPNISCIPTGTYKCEQFISSKHGLTYIVDEVPGRAGILFHIGNQAEDTQGCILVACAMRPNDNYISDSHWGFERLMNIVELKGGFLLLVENSEWRSTPA